MRRSRRTWLKALLLKDNVCNEVHCECELAAWVEEKREEVAHLLAGEQHWGAGKVLFDGRRRGGGGGKGGRRGELLVRSENNFLLKDLKCKET
jgi:hypothetical protein